MARARKTTTKKTGTRKTSKSPAKSQAQLFPVTTVTTTTKRTTVRHTYASPDDRKAHNMNYTSPRGPAEAAKYERDRKKDNKRVAKAPGKRVSANGNVYYEHRENRSDLPKDRAAAKAWQSANKKATKKTGTRKTAKKSGARKSKK